DLVLTDPPYGIGADSGVGGFGVSKTDKHYSDAWDAYPPDQSTINLVISRSPRAIVFGGQFFDLPTNGHWIVWDKKGDIQFDNPYGDCELAWTNFPRKSVKKYSVVQQGFVSRERTRFHPTQKPVRLMIAILLDYLDDGLSVLDPFMGSGTTL